MDPDLMLQPSHVALFCACMEGIVHYLEYETEPETMAPFLTAKCFRVVAECIEGVTVKRETCLRLAIKNSQFEAIKVMVEWILEMEKEDILNLKDELGNTILHLAILIRQYYSASSNTSSKE
ncbi:hypothetical protein GOBAR_AA10052 [Gossypium barbadense]|uniref:Uncharacterized protein n=1 Tax=Gossypium barbadense TaxID=3634 RepID=A0A2P5Y4T0_GOSBA|nr:hypothetical protein GOBAR_AA10052 [Gossypium barbadense]